MKDLLISVRRYLRQDFPNFPWLDRKMGVGPGWGVTLLAVGLAMNIGPFLRLLPWAKQWLQILGWAQ